MGFLNGLFSRSNLRLNPTPQNPRITDVRTKLSWIAPGEGELIPPFPESPVSPAFDGGFRLSAHPVEVRLRHEIVNKNPHLAPPPENAPHAPPPTPNGELTHNLCVHYT